MKTFVEEFEREIRDFVEAPEDFIEPEDMLKWFEFEEVL